MKKILIALPLVLIMILSMVPVFADNEPADQEVKTKITFYTDVHKTNKGSDIDTTLYVTETVAKDAKLLKAEIEKQAKETYKSAEPKIDTETKFEFIYDAVVTTKTVNKTPASVKAEPYGALTDKTMAALKKITQESGVTLDTATNSVADTDVAKDELIKKINAEIDKMVKDGKKGTATVVVESQDVEKTSTAELTVELNKLVEVPGSEEPVKATATVSVYPDRVLKEGKKEDKKEEKKCYVACDKITVKVMDETTGLEVEELRRVFDVVKGRLPEISAAIEYMIQSIEHEGYMVATNWSLTPAIFAPENLENCVAVIHVIPQYQLVDVIHELYTCCKKPDGTQYFQSRPVMSFLEEGVWVPFVEFNVQRIINQVKAEEWATTRIQKLNSGEWVFASAEFVDALDYGKYLTGSVYDKDGKPMYDFARKFEDRRFIRRPTIIVKYKAAVCVEKTEEKVDNATVENGNATTAPVTANGGANLPATGAKDVSAFFLSAVALLGLGIFFAKKH